MLYYRKFRNDSSHTWVTFIHGAGGSSAIWYKQIKEFTKHFNVLLIDLRGHGKSKEMVWKKGDTFTHIAEEVISVLDHLHIATTHFVGISLGTIVIQTIAHEYPNRVSSMILGGAVTKLDLRTNALLLAGNMGKYVLPYMWLYQLFAWIIMPRAAHAESRAAFVEQAAKMNQKEFIRWFSVTRAINPFLRKLQSDFFAIPTLFIMGEEDYLFLKPVRELVERKSGLRLACIQKSGHVCNIDQPELFNQAAIQFVYEMRRLEAVL